METLSQLFTLTTSLQSTYRSLQIQRFNAQIAAKTRSPASSMLCLPDDILLIIFDLLQQSDRQYILEGQIAEFAACGRARHIVSRTPHTTHRRREGEFVRFSTTCRRVRRLAEPRLFKTVRMGSSWSPERAAKALQSLSSSDSAKCYTRELSLDIWSGPDVQTPAAAKKLLRLGQDFIRAAQALDRLEKLTLTLPASTALALHGAFKVAGVEGRETALTGVKELVLSPFMHWIIEYCPNVRSIESNDWVLHGIARMDLVAVLIEAAGQAPFLEHFSLHCRWRIELLEKAVQTMPHLKSLALRGGQYLSDMSRMLSVLKKMPKLERLELLDARSVNDVLHHRDSHHSASGPFFWVDVMTSSQEKVTNAVFQSLWTLKTLSLGGYFVAKVVSRGKRKIDVRWEITACDTPAGRYLQRTLERTVSGAELCIGGHGGMELSCDMEDTWEQTCMALEFEDEDELRELELLQEEMNM